MRLGSLHLPEELRICENRLLSSIILSHELLQEDLVSGWIWARGFGFLFVAGRASDKDAANQSKE